MSTVFALTADELCTAVLRLQGVLAEDETASSTKLAAMRQALNLLLKQWAIDNIHLWTVQELVLTAPTLVSGTPTYTIGSTGAALTANRPLRIIEAFLRNTSGSPPAQNDVTLQQLSRHDWAMLGNKFSTGVTNSYYYSPDLPNGTLYLYVAPDSTTITYEVHLFSQRQLLDVNAGTDSLDLTQEYVNAVKWGLADETAMENQIPDERADRIGRRAAFYRKQLSDWDVEEASVYFQPDMVRMGSR